MHDSHKLDEDNDDYRTQVIKHWVAHGSNIGDAEQLWADMTDDPNHSDPDLVTSADPTIDDRISQYGGLPKSA